MNKPWKNVAFEELGGFENIGKDLGRFPFRDGEFNRKD